MCSTMRTRICLVYCNLDSACLLHLTACCVSLLQSFCFLKFLFVIAQSLLIAFYSRQAYYVRCLWHHIFGRFPRRECVEVRWVAHSITLFGNQSVRSAFMGNVRAPFRLLLLFPIPSLSYSYLIYTHYYIYRKLKVTCCVLLCKVLNNFFSNLILNSWVRLSGSRIMSSSAISASLPLR